jgi:hypothetical protein
MPAVHVLAARQMYRVVNPDAQDYTRVCLLIGVVTKEDDPDVQPARVVRFPDGADGAFWREELEPYER